MLVHFVKPSVPFGPMLAPSAICSFKHCSEVDIIYKIQIFFIFFSFNSSLSIREVTFICCLEGFGGTKKRS
jgi:hypothetical protein